MDNKFYPFTEAPQKIGMLKGWLLAARPKTLPVSFPPIILGTFLAAQTVQIEWTLTVYALLCSLCIQIGTNIVNDALDFKKGADTSERLGPQRMTQSGILSFRQVLTGGIVCFIFAMLFGIPLMLAGGGGVFFVLSLSVICGYLYTGGPFPLAYTGLSDLFVLIFFGWVSTGTVYYLQTEKYSWECFLASTQIGLLAVVPHTINHLRDHVSDARIGKRTLVVRFGKLFARWEISLLSFIPFLLGFFWWRDHYPFMALLPFLCLPIIIQNVWAICTTEPSVMYNEFLAKSALCELLFGGLLALGIFLE